MHFQAGSPLVQQCGRLGAIEKLPLLYRKHSKRVRLLTILEPCAARVWRAYSAGPLGSRRDCARSLTFAVWRRVRAGTWWVPGV
jgi:hypothetical protein